MPLSPRNQNVAIAIVAVVAAVSAWMLFRPDDIEAAIHKRLDALEELAHKEGGESQFETIGKARKAASYVTEHAELELLPGMHVAGRSALSNSLATLRSGASHIDLRLGSRQITVVEPGDRAIVTLIATASGEGFGERRNHRARYRTEWVKQDGDWLISHSSRIDD